LMKAAILIATFGLFIATALPPMIYAANDSGINTSPPANKANQIIPFPRLWKGLLPSGNEISISILNLGDEEYMFKFAGNFSGTYKREGEKLVISKPTDPRLSGFVWKIKDDNTLVLIAQPDTSMTGSDYTGTTLKRVPNEDKQ
jgi:hypothetical protein